MLTNIARKWPVIREGIGGFLLGGIAGLLAMVAGTCCAQLFKLEWVMIPGLLAALSLPPLLAIRAARREIRRQIETGVRPNPGDMIHPFFGPLDAECNGDKDDRWHGEIPFAPVMDRLSVTILAGYDGPSDKHVEFVNWLKTNFHEVVQLLEPKLRRRYNRSHESAPVNLLDEFSLCSLTIPRDGDMNNEWEIAFTSNSDRAHVFGVAFENGKPSCVMMDG